MFDLIVFNISGFMGHFRKVYSTTSSLSYMFPPRTAITGLIAGILGRDRDSYYDEFSPEHCRVAVGLNHGIRKLVQQVLYLNTDTIDEQHLRGTCAKESRVPTALELLFAEPPKTQIAYRIYFHHIKSRLMEELTDRLTAQHYKYPPSLGLTECPAILTLVDHVSAELINSQKPLPISTTIPQSKFVELIPSSDRRLYREDRVPLAFNVERRIQIIEDFVFEAEGKPVEAVIQGGLFKCQVKGEGDIYGVFMA